MLLNFQETSTKTLSSDGKKIDSIADSNKKSPNSFENKTEDENQYMEKSLMSPNNADYQFLGRV